MPSNSYKFFRNTDCEYFPCHQTNDKEQFNCLFCFCPLYSLGSQCGGNFVYSGKIRKVKNCSNCNLPHDPNYYDHVISKLKEVNNK